MGFGFTVVILFFSNLSVNKANATINATDRTININDGQIQQVFIAKLTGSQEIPFVNIDAMGTALITNWLSTYIHLKPYLSYPLFEKGFFY